MARKEPEQQSGSPKGGAGAKASEFSFVFEEIRAIAADSSPANALRRTLATVARLFRTRSTFVSVFEPSLGMLQIGAARGRADRRVVAVAPGEGAVGLAYESGESQVADGVLAIPMQAEGKVLGALALIGGTFTEGKQPDDVELSMLGALANAAAASVALATARNENERHVRQLEAAAQRVREGDRTRDAILSHISHELRTPLTTIKAYLAMLSKERLGPLSDKQQNALAVSERNADRLLRLINDLLLTARLQAGRMTLDPKPLGLRSVLEEAIRFLQDDLDTARVEVRLEAPEGEVFIRGNRDRLVEGFMHLLERGLHRDRGGGPILIRLLPKGRTGHISLSYPGFHLAKEEVDGLFDPFRLGNGASNLGLNIARQILELHGGQIGVERGADGLRFEASLPLFAGLVSNETPALQPRPGEILVVEDDDDCRNGIVEYLSAENFVVRAFADGQSALQRIQEVPPALVLLDLRMPGVDGAALIKEVREREQGQRTPIYVISGTIDAQAGADAVWGERVDGVFEKPINFPYLLERVRECVLDGPPAPPPTPR